MKLKEGDIAKEWEVFSINKSKEDADATSNSLQEFFADIKNRIPDLVIETRIVELIKKPWSKS
jgi:hypothetical protein